MILPIFLPHPKTGQPEDEDGEEEEDRVADGEGRQQRGEVVAQPRLDEHVDGHERAHQAEDGDRGQGHAVDEEDDHRGAARRSRRSKGRVSFCNEIRDILLFGIKLVVISRLNKRMTLLC